MATPLIMLQRALDASGITMIEAFISEWLHAHMEERLAVHGMDHQMNTKKASLFRRKADVEGPMNASDRLRIKASCEKITASRGDIDCLLFWRECNHFDKFRRRARLPHLASNFSTGLK